MPVAASRHGGGRVTAVAHAFGLRDASLVQRLQRSGTLLDLESAVLEPVSPLGAALRAYLTHGVRERHRMTFILNSQAQGRRLRGFIQVQVRATRPEADVVFLAPSLGSRDTGATPEVWERLLAFACQQVGAAQRQRVFARLPTGDSEAIEIFRHVGFVVYAQEHIFRLDRTPAALPATNLALRPYEPRDSWGVQRLYCHAAPRPVQQLECQPGGGWDIPGVSLSREAQQYVWDVESELHGYVSVRRGVHGAWLHVFVDYDNIEATDDLVVCGLALLGPGVRPVFCAARGYEPGLQHSLQRLGFRPHGSFLLLAKSTTAPIRDPVLNWLAVPERGVEAAPTPSRIHAVARR